MLTFHQTTKAPLANLRPSLTSIALCLVLCLALGGTQLASAQPPNGNANTHYPIWSELSYFERSALGDLPKAFSNDPNALLALYIMASGARDLSELQNAQEQIKKFIKTFKEKGNHKHEKAVIADLLNTEMHDSFFIEKRKDEAPQGYREGQSQLTGIFDSGTYNCISSSLLYIVLARHFDIDAQGVLLPSHAFVQLNLKNAKTIEVETTSDRGFNQVHDEAFYEKVNANWFSSRGLEPASYQDYLERDLVTATYLGVQNMLNQHTSEQRMDIEDSGRLAEISAYIRPTYQLANEKRIYFYIHEINKLISAQNWEDLGLFFSTTYQVVMRDSVQFPDSNTLQHNLRAYLSGALLAHAKKGNVDATLEVMGELMARGLESPEHRQTIENRVINAVKLLLNKLSDQNRFEEGLLVLSLLEGHLTEPRDWEQMFSWLYLRWIEPLWEEQKWEEVVAVLADYVDHPSPSKNDPTIEKSMADAYYNWVIKQLNSDDLLSGKRIVEQCSYSNHNHLCSKAKQTFLSYEAAHKKARSKK